MKLHDGSRKALKEADNGFFEFKVAQGRSAAWDALGDLKQATALPGGGGSPQALMFPSRGGGWRSSTKR